MTNDDEPTMIKVMVGNRYTVQSARTGQTRCPGCGNWFRGARGLRAHMSRRFNTLACKPSLKPEKPAEDEVRTKCFQREPDEHGNRIAREGFDRCACGVKYWENDKCVDCGASVLAIQEVSNHGEPA